MSAPTIERPGPVDSFTDEQGSRFYEIDDHQYWSVTTALKIMAKDGLPPWAGGLAARAAFDELPKIVVASITKPCNNTHSRCRRPNGGHDWRLSCSVCPCRACSACVTKWLAERHIAVRDRRADEGRRTHDVIEQWVTSNGEVDPHKDDIAPFVRAFLAFVKAYGLKPDSWLLAEATVVNRAEEYAGTTDGVLRFEARATESACDVVAMLHQEPKSVCVARGLIADVIVDFKTKDEPPEKAAKFYDDVALQLAPYRHAPVVRIKRLGIEEPMPNTHGAMAVQLRPDMAIPRLCVADELTYEAFLKALWLYRWRIEHGAAAVSSRSFKVPKEPEAPKAPRATRAPTCCPHPVGVHGPDGCGAADGCDCPKPAPVKRAPAKRASTAAKKATTKAAEPPALLPVPGAGPPLREVAAAQSATLRGITRLADMPVHADSPFDDELPF